MPTIRPNLDTRSSTRLAVAAALGCLVLLAVSSTAVAQTPADHLLVSEVGYNTVANPEDNEFIEIFNPTDQTIVLNDGTAAYYLSDDNAVYYQVVNGTVTHAVNSDWTLGFPPGSSIPPGGIIVVTGNAASFATEFFGGNLQAFYDQPGSPQLFEFQANADAVPDMINVGNGPSMSLTNGGEDVILYWWDGTSDLVADVDHMTWVDTAELIDKTGVAIDGPDADMVQSTYLPDAGGAVAAPNAPQGQSLARSTPFESGEVAGGGNGLTGHDESTERFDQSFTITAPTPGRLPTPSVDGLLADVLWLGPPLAVSDQADGASGLTSDYGADGSVSELYAAPVDTDGDGVLDTLHVAIRGEFFGSSAAINGTFLLIDAAPGSARGPTRLISNTNQVLDTQGTLDTHITQLEVELSAALVADGIGIDAVVGLTEATATPCQSTDTCGLRGFGTDNTTGQWNDFAHLDTMVALGTVESGLPAAPGTVWTAPQVIEMGIPLAALGNPAVVALAVVTSPDTTGSGASPNMLPENAATAPANPQVIEAVIYVPITVTSCTDDADCGDCGVCGALGVCEPGNEGSTCDDANACTSATTCTAGTCGGGTSVSCDASGDTACMVNTCVPATGACELQPANEGNPCDDGVMCTDGDVCTAGTCAGTAVDCSSEGDACNTASCDETTGACTVLTPVNEGGACDDGDLCSTGEACASGACVGGSVVDCSADGDACNAASCDATTGLCTVLTPTNEGNPCDDGDACTENDACAAGTCTGTLAPAGTACGDACNAGTCDPVTGACMASPLPDDTACDDDNPCTSNDVCTAGACAGSPAAPGASCDDGSDCTLDDTCTDGVCVGTPMDCSDLDRTCVVGVCNASTGLCESSEAPDGTACDDDNACTESDVCLDGSCTALEAPDGTACDDGDMCTGGDQCVAGVCTAGTEDACADPEPTDDVSSPDMTGGADMVLDGGASDDGGDDCGCQVRADGPSTPRGATWVGLLVLVGLAWRRRTVRARG